MHPDIAKLDLAPWPEGPKRRPPMPPEPKKSPIQLIAEAVKDRRRKLFSHKVLVHEDCGCGEGEECPSGLCWEAYEPWPSYPR
jgi:hypothetical protein